MKIIKIRYRLIYIVKTRVARRKIKKKGGEKQTDLLEGSLNMSVTTYTLKIK
jgi:hypothetical protein